MINEKRHMLVSLFYELLKMISGKFLLINKQYLINWENFFRFFFVSWIKLQRFFLQTNSSFKCHFIFKVKSSDLVEKKKFFLERILCDVYILIKKPWYYWYLISEERFELIEERMIKDKIVKDIFSVRFFSFFYINRRSTNISDRQYFFFDYLRHCH